MHSRYSSKSPFTKKLAMFMLAFLLVCTAIPVSPALASTEPEALPIYVRIEQFAHSGVNANVSNDGTRGLYFPVPTFGRPNTATTANGRLRVVPVTNDSSGIVVRTNKIKLDGGFSTYFVMHLSESNSLNSPNFPGPADGLTFIIQDNPVPLLGGIGEGVGYAGIPNSVGVEFDTWSNTGNHQGIYYNDPINKYSLSNRYHPVNNPNGPTADHVAIVMNGVNNHASGSGDVIDNLQNANFRLYDYAANNAYIHVWVDYDDNGNLTATYGLSNNRTDINNRSITRDVGMTLMNKEVYVGFGASTGGANSHHDILAWYFKNSYVPGGLDPNGNYKQGPNAVVIDKVNNNDGTVSGLDIKVKGISTNVNLPDEIVDIYINGLLVDGDYVTSSTGDLIYTFDENSHLQAGNNTITVITRNGGTSSASSVVQTVTPNENDLQFAHTPNGIVTINQVPNGVKAALYNENNEFIATLPVASNGTVRVELTDTEKEKFMDASQIKISYSRIGEVSSPKVAILPVSRSDAPKADDIKTNAKDNTVTVKDVPPGTTVNVYDENDQVIGTATNPGTSDEDVLVTIEFPHVLKKGDTVKVSLKEDGKEESERVPSEAKLVSESLDGDNIKTNASDQKVTVKDVPPGETINVYNKNGELIGTATNNGSSTEEVVVTIVLLHVLTEGEIVDVTVTKPGSLESTPVPSQAKVESKPLVQPDVKASVSGGRVTVEDVPPGATIIIYDEDGKELKRVSNPGPETNSVVIEPLDLEPGTKLQATITEVGKFESKPLLIEVQFTADEAIDDALKKLQIGYQGNDTWESVTQPVFIVTAGANDTKVEWTSSKTRAIEITQSESETIATLVHRQAKDESVILTASVSKNGLTKSRTFLLIVKAENLTKITLEDYRTVKVIGGSSDEVNEQVGIDRITLSNGVKIDKAIFDMVAATRFINDARTRNGVSTVYVDEILNDEPGEIAVEIPGQSVGLLSSNGNSLDVRTEYATLSIAASVLAQMSDNYLDLFFRLIPVKDSTQQAQIKSGISNEAVVKAASGNREVEVLGSSLEIETNYRDYATKLFLPFAKNGITVPAGNASVFLNSLRVYVEHSDGEKVVKTGTVVYDGRTPIGLEIDIDKFSVFTIIQLKNRPVVGISPPVTPVPPVEPAPQGTEQVKTGILDPSKGTIVLELVTGSPVIDKSGFTVKVGGKNVEIKEIIISGNQVTLTLKDAIPSGYEAIISYTPLNGSAEGALQLFTDLKIANPDHHVAYIKGFPDGTFRPDHTITRAEMSAILARNKNLADSSPYQQLYPDVAQVYWAASYIEQLKDVGLLIGDSNGNFRPGDRITRAEMAMVASRWMNADLEGTFENAFEDVSGSHWAAAAIAAVSEAGIMIGFEDGTFGLDKYVTRAQAVTIMNRLLGRGPLTGVPAPSWPDAASHWAFEHIEEASQDHDFTYLPDGRELLYQQ